MTTLLVFLWPHPLPLSCDSCHNFKMRKLIFRLDENLVSHNQRGKEPKRRYTRYWGPCCHWPARARVCLSHYSMQNLVQRDGQGMKWDLDELGSCALNSQTSPSVFWSFNLLSPKWGHNILNWRKYCKHTHFTDAMVLGIVWMRSFSIRA